MLEGPLIVSWQVLESHRWYAEDFKPTVRCCCCMKLIIRMNKMLIKAAHEIYRGDLRSKGEGREDILLQKKWISIRFCNAIERL